MLHRCRIYRNSIPTSRASMALNFVERASSSEPSSPFGASPFIDSRETRKTPLYERQPGTFPKRHAIGPHPSPSDTTRPRPQSCQYLGGTGVPASGSWHQRTPDSIGPATTPANPPRIGRAMPRRFSNSNRNVKGQALPPLTPFNVFVKYQELTPIVQLTPIVHQLPPATPPVTAVARQTVVAAAPTVVLLPLPCRPSVVGPSPITAPLPKPARRSTPSTDSPLSRRTTVSGTVLKHIAS